MNEVDFTLCYSMKYMLVVRFQDVSNCGPNNNGHPVSPNAHDSPSRVLEIANYTQVVAGASERDVEFIANAYRTIWAHQTFSQLGIAISATIGHSRDVKNLGRNGIQHSGTFVPPLDWATSHSMPYLPREIMITTFPRDGND